MRVLVLVAMLLPMLATLWTDPAPAAAAERKLVFAFYYAWYEMSDWRPEAMPFQPIQKYSGGDPATLRRHLKQAEQAGIDSFVVSWWGQGDRTDDRLAALLNMAQRESPVRMAVYLEPEATRLKGRGPLVNGIRYLLQRHAAHPAFIRYRGKPVIFVWRPESVDRPPGQSVADAWRQILDEADPGRNAIWSAEGIDLGLLDTFDGLHQFGAALWAADPGASNRSFRTKIDNYNAARGTNKIWAPGTAPGHDNSRQDVPNPIVVDRQGGEYFRRNYGGAISSNPDWICIVSFNEWGEGTQIEPATAYGDQYLNIAREMADAWKGKPSPATARADFDRVWRRADALVAGGAVSRAWLWGPTPFDDRVEPYQEAPTGQRVVRYYDKARMEVTQPNPNGGSLVTNGLLARELIGGEIQEGDGAFRKHRPGAVPVAGDMNAKGAVTYADLNALASWRGDNRAPDRTGQPIVERFTTGRRGGVSADGGLGRHGVVGGYYDGNLGHNIASPIWDYFNRTGPVAEGGGDRVANGRVLNWLTDVGLPLMEPVWAQAMVGGVQKDVLLQCFERRCLTYTPDNAPDWRVEMGNVGRHYFAWRYGG